MEEWKDYFIDVLDGVVMGGGKERGEE